MVQETTSVFGRVVIRLPTTLCTVKVQARHDGSVMTTSVPMKKDVREKLLFILATFSLSNNKTFIQYLTFTRK